MPVKTELSNQPKTILDLPPGGLCTLTEVLPAAVVVVVVDGWLGSTGVSAGFVVVGTCLGLVGLVGSVSQANEKLLFPPGA